MGILLTILAVVLVVMIIGFVIETLFWLGVVAAIVFVAVAAYGAIKGRTAGKSIGR